MDVDQHSMARWGNLHGRLYLLTDTTGLIDFGTMLRSR
jgi:hypothetical protein